MIGVFCLLVLKYRGFQTRILGNYSLQTDLSKLGATASALFIIILINFVKIFQ